MEVAKAMAKILIGIIALGMALTMMSGCREAAPTRNSSRRNIQGTIRLPEPSLQGEASLEAVLLRRVSRRNFSVGAISLGDLGQLLWAAQGQASDARSGATRTAPSAGATHPLQIYVVVGNVEDLQVGIYLYQQRDHSLVMVAAGHFESELAAVALGQGFLARAAVNLVLTADYGLTTGRYGERGRRYVYMEVGHATQNILLQSEALRLGAVAVGAFYDERLVSLLETETAPLMIVPIGRFE